MPNTVKRKVTNTQLIYFWILNLFHPTYSGGLKISPSILLWLSDLGLRCPFFFLLSYFTYSFIYLLSYFKRWLTSPCDSVFFTEYVPSSSSTIRVFLSRGLSGIYKHIKKFPKKCTLQQADLINSFLINLSSAVWSDWCILTNCPLTCFPYI